MSHNLSSILSRRFLPRKPVKLPIVSRTKTSRRESANRKLELQLLEGRVVPAAPLVSFVTSGTASTAITGTVYDDLDQNGVKSPGENGIRGWTVYLDLDNSGTLNRDAAGVLEPSAITNVDGIFTIKNLQPGTYRVAEVMQSGWEATAAISQDVLVTSGKSTKADFFNFSGGNIAGTVWNDLNHDGIRAIDPVTGAFADPGLPGWTVFLDLNNNGTADADEPTTITDANGDYSFSNLQARDYEVTEVKPSTWEVSPGPYDIKQTASVVARTTVVQDFANFSLTDGSLQGTIWNDLNADGVRQTDPTTGAFTEPGLADWTVFLDTNNNGVADPGEQSTLTDADGNYSFLTLPAGDYEVTEVLPPGWNVSPTFDTRQTVSVMPGERATASDFANFSTSNGSVRGTVWGDLNRNSLRDVNLAGAFTDPGLANWSVFLDLNRNGVVDPAEPITLTDANGVYTFTGLQVGDYEVREVLPAGWEPSSTFSDSYPVTVFSGSTTTAHDFANFNIATATPGSVSGTVWNDLNANGVRDVDTSGAFTDPGLAGWTVFADLNSNGVLDATEPKATSAADGSYTITGIRPGTVTIVEQSKAGWNSTSPLTSSHTVALKNAGNVGSLDFGNSAQKNSTISGKVFADTNKDSLFSPGEKGLANIGVYLDLNNNSVLDAGEPQTLTSSDQFFTPGVDESGDYSFTHLAAGNYTVRVILPTTLSATPANQLAHGVSIVNGVGQPAVDFAAQYRANEIRGIKFDDTNGNHVRDAGEAGIANDTVFVDLNRNNVQDAGEPTTQTQSDGSYKFTNLTPGAYVVREVVPAGQQLTYPLTTGGILWPQGVSNPAVGNVTPNSITASLAIGQTLRQTVSITLPNTGALTNLVDVFLLFDDTGSFVNNSPIVRAAFPDIITQLQSSLPGIDLGFGVGRFEEYANFASEYATGRPFILNQPIVAASTSGYMTAIQAALNRTTPGYGGDQPETDIEALYQLVTGAGFDGNNNGSVLDSGAAGLVSTQLNPGASGDVPSFASFRADPTGSVLPAAGNIGGGGFRSGALPIILVATDTGFAFQPMGETSVTGVGGVSVPVSSLTQTSRPTTPFNSGAGLQQTVTGLNALGGLVIGLGTNPQPNIDPRQGLEALSKLTGAVNRSTTTIANGTADPIAPGDPLFFEIASGFSGSVANGVVNAIQNAVTNVAVDVTVQASDPRVRITNYSGVRSGVGSGQAATFDIEFIGDGVPHRFDLQFVRSGTNVVLGSIPVVLGTPIAGDGYEFEDLAEGEIHTNVDFGSQAVTTSVSAPAIAATGGNFAYDGLAHSASANAAGMSGSTVAGTFSFTYNGSGTVPTAAGTYSVVANFTSSDPNYANATATTTLTISAIAPTVAATGGIYAFDGLAHPASAIATGLGGTAVPGSISFTYNGFATVPTAAGTYTVVANFTSSDPNYTNASGTATLVIGVTSPTITVTGGTSVFDGLAHTASANATGLGGASVPGTFTITYNGLLIAPIAAGTYDVVATFISSDPNYSNSNRSTTLTILPANPTATVAAGGPYPYDGLAHAASVSAIGFGGLPVAGTFLITYNGSAIVPTQAGVYAVVANFTSNDPNYGSATTATTLTIHAVASTVTVNGGTFGYDGLAHAASVTATGLGGVAVGGTVSITYNGSTSLPSQAGTYAVAANFVSSNPNYLDAVGMGTITINPALSGFSNINLPSISTGTATSTVSGKLASGGLSVAGGNVSVTFNGITQTVVTDSTGSFTATLSTGGLAVGTYPVALAYNGDANHTAATSSGQLSVTSVTVVSQPAGKTKEAEFWATGAGQALIRGFNGGITHTELAAWLATNFSNLYGSGAGVNDLTGKTNADVSLLFQRIWRSSGDGAEAQVLTTALNVYATTTSLGGAQAVSYGFKISAGGQGAKTFNVRSFGAAVGVANNTVMTVYDMLRAVNSRAVNGVLYGGNKPLTASAKSLFDELNSI